MPNLESTVKKITIVLKIGFFNEKKNFILIPRLWEKVTGNYLGNEGDKEGSTPVAEEKFEGVFWTFQFQITN